MLEMKTPAIILLYALAIGNCAFQPENNADVQDTGSLLVGPIGTSSYAKKPSKIAEIKLPRGFSRLPADSPSFAHFLRNLPLDTSDNNIYAFNGSIISRGGYHHAVVKMDIGNRDLQQCADAIMRLRAEYFYGMKQFNRIHFNFVSDGKPRYYTNYCNGDFSYKTFRKYLDYLFAYANTASLIKELKPVENVSGMQIGNVFIQTGKPFGHAVIIVDMAIDNRSGKKIFLVAQSFMPAQSIHILRNMAQPDIDPWYPLDFEEPVDMVTWSFYRRDLKSFE
jgi:hypothetical protein